MPPAKGAALDPAAHAPAKPVAAQLHQLLRAQVSEWYGPGAQLPSAAPAPIRRRQSFQWRYTAQLPDGAARWLMVKVPRPLDGPEPLAQVVADPALHTAAQGEFAALRLAAECPALHDEARFLRLRPMAYLPAFNAIVTELLDARPLPALLTGRLAWGGPAAWQPLARGVSRAAQWLAAFHQELGQPDLYLPWAPDLRVKVARALDRLKGLAVERATLTHFQRRFETLIAGLEHTPAATAWLHGDLSAANVLVDAAGRVAVIDIGRDRRGPVYFDLALLLVSLTTRWPQVLSAGVWLPWPAIQQLWHAALSAYPAGLGGDRRVAYVYAAMHTLHLWREYERTLARYPRPLVGPARLILRRYLAQAVERYLDLAALPPSHGR